MPVLPPADARDYDVDCRSQHRIYSIVSRPLLQAARNVVKKLV